jgi:hypothetical protein
MPYDFELTTEAEDDLIERWLQATNRMSVTRAAHRIEQFLRVDPHQGQHQSEGLYRVCDPPLVVYYEIVEDKQLVSITNILAYRQPPAA